MQIIKDALKTRLMHAKGQLSCERNEKDCFTFWMCIILLILQRNLTTILSKIGILIEVH